MDFASIMKSQIAKTKNIGKDSLDDPQTGSGSKGNASKYVRRADLEAERLAKYQAEQEQAETARREKLAKRQREEDEERERAAVRLAKKQKLAEESRVKRDEEAKLEENARRKRFGLSPLREFSDGGVPSAEHGSSDDDGDENEYIPDEELRKNLRKLREPVALFAETHKARLRRFRRLTGPVVVMSNGPIPTTISLLPEPDIEEVSEKPPPRSNAVEREKLIRILASYFTLVLEEWCRALAARSTEVKTSAAGRQAFGSYESAKSAMTPLFRAFERSLAQIKRMRRQQRRQGGSEDGNGKDNGDGSVGDGTDGPENHSSIKPLRQQTRDGGAKARKDEEEEEPAIAEAVLEGIVQIVHAAQQRRYVAASDAYLTLSIGKAAWPIGVTMVGIHARSAREKLHEGDGGRKAHIMSDEATRKYLQAIKSCLGFAQTRWPPADHLQLMG